MIRRITKPHHRNDHTQDAHGLNLRVVWIGGGGGSVALLRALWNISPRIVALICVTDDGTDSGKLRREMGWAPGDIRRALVALAANPEGKMAQMLSVRFDERFPERAGQSFGNSVFAAAALCGLDMADQIKMVARLLGVTGMVCPATIQTSVRLVGELLDGSFVHGELSVAASGSSLRRVCLDPEGAAPPPESREAIRLADAVIIGPGSVATSLIPAMIPSACILAETLAARFLVVNAWSEGDDDFATAADYVRFITGHFPDRRLFDCIICHQHPSKIHPNSSGGRPVTADLDAIRAMGYAAVGADLLGADGRHNGQKVASLVATLTPQFSRQSPVTQHSRRERIKSVRFAHAIYPCRSEHDYFPGD